MSGPTAALLSGGDRLHLQHGPIDLIISADGDRKTAFRAAATRFATVLDDLVAELPLLRRPVGEEPSGIVARRMVAAVRPHGSATFITPMAAVAGAVAEEILAAMVDKADLDRAYVNNGGDIALHLTPGTRYRLAVASPANQALGLIDIRAEDPVRGIATSGQGGRSFSLGIADAVTVLAPTAGVADALATIIANEVDLPGHPAIIRTPACEIQPDNDLGPRLVVTRVGPLSPSETAAALDRGAAQASSLIAAGYASAVGLFLNHKSRTLGSAENLLNWNQRELTHA